MKKILSLAIVMMMVLSTFTMAFAGTFEDVESDNDNVTAIEALSALDVFDGLPDGTFNTEGIVKRGQMAKLVVVAKGLANIASGQANFTDVSADHWATGYIAVASQLGIVNGRGNGIFDPEAEVTYTEAAIMLLRAIGYTDANVNATGDTYSTVAYQVKANELGLFDDVANINAPCPRGDIAGMIFTAIKASMVTTDENGNAVAVTPASTLIAGLADEGTTYVSPADAATYSILADYANMYVDTYYVGDDNTAEDVVFVTGETYTSYDVDEADTDTAYVASVSGSVVTVTIDGDAYDMTLDSDSYSYFNNEQVSATSNFVTASDDTFTITVDDTSTVMTIMTITKEEMSGHVQVSTVYTDGETSFEGQSLPLDDDSDFDADSLIVTGAVSSIEDIAVDDVVEYYTNTDGVYKMVVTRDSFEGKVTKVVAADSEYYINGTAYTLSSLTSPAVALASEGEFFLDSDGAIYAYAAATEDTDTVTGLIYGLRDGIASTSTVFGSDSATMPQVALYLLDGTSATYDLAVDSSLAGTITTSGKIAVTTGVFTITTDETFLATDGTGVMIDHVDTASASTSTDEAVLATLTLDSDGCVTDITTLDGTTVADLDFDSAVTQSLENSDTMYVGFDATDGAFETYTAADFDGSVDVTTYVDGYYTYILANEELTEAVNTTKYAWVVTTSDVLDSDDATVQEFTAYVDGSKMTYTTDSDYTANIVESEFTVIELDDAGMVISAAKATGESTTATAIGATLTSTSTLTYLDTDCVYYKLNSNGDLIVISKTQLSNALNTQPEVITVYELNTDTTTHVIDAIVWDVTE